MTSKTPLTFACGAYDRMDALRTSEVAPTGIDLNFLTIDHPREIFDRMMGGHEFDASEMSSSEYICCYAAGKRDFVAIPVFPSRVFRHGFIAIDSNQVKKVKDLEGKKIGVQIYTMTAAVWIRSLLAQEGVDLSSIEWVEGALEQPGGHGKPSSQLPLENVKLSKNMDSARGLSQLLADGDIAATIGAALPSCLENTTNIERLFPDFQEREKVYYRDTGIFPIMHLVVIKRAIVEQYPWVPSSLFDAFQQSKEIALKSMRSAGTSRYMSPWLPSESDEMGEVFEGGDPWVYGLEGNERTLNALVKGLWEQGMIERKPTLEELFWPVRQDL